MLKTEIGQYREYKTVTAKISDNLFPAALKSISKAPPSIYIKGNIAALKHTPSVTIIGARDATKYAIAAASNLAKSAAEQGVRVVSGGALGCDAAAHTAAIMVVGGITVAVVAHGLDYVGRGCNLGLFLEILKSGGCLLSIYPAETAPNKKTYTSSSEIQVALSPATIVVQAAVKSGTLITADSCIAQGKKLFCLQPPAALLSTEKEYAGNVKLIDKKSATIITDAKDISFIQALATPGETKQPTIITMFAQQQKKLQQSLSQSSAASSNSTYLDSCAATSKPITAYFAAPGPQKGEVQANLRDKKRFREEEDENDAVIENKENELLQQVKARKIRKRL